MWLDIQNNSENMEFTSFLQANQSVWDSSYCLVPHVWIDLVIITQVLYHQVSENENHQQQCYVCLLPMLHTNDCNLSGWKQHPCVSSQFLGPKSRQGGFSALVSWAAKCWLFHVPFCKVISTNPH